MLVLQLNFHTTYSNVNIKKFQKKRIDYLNNQIIKYTNKKIIIDLIANFKESLDFGGFLKNINNRVISQKNANKNHPMSSA